jgi:dephospho-CoA kinase
LGGNEREFTGFSLTGKRVKKAILIGITGGIGAGKSALGKIYAEAGYPVFSADAIAREILAPGTPGWQKVVDTFGKQILASNGEIDRPRLRAKISNNEEDRKKLDSITHPLIQIRSQQLFHEAVQQGNQIVFYEAPLLFEANSHKKMDKVICVHASDATRIQRTMDRDHKSREEVEKLLKGQMAQEEKMQRSDFLIENEGTEEQLRTKGLALVRSIIGE